MKRFLLAVAIGGLAMSALLLLEPVAGSAQGSATAPAATPPPTSTPSITDATAAKFDPDCKTADVACAWSHCNPLAQKWQSYRACIDAGCHVQPQSCLGDLIMDLNDPDRQKTGGAG